MNFLAIIIKQYVDFILAKSGGKVGVQHTYKDEKECRAHTYILLTEIFTDMGANVPLMGYKQSWFIIQDTEYNSLVWNN